MSEIVFVYGTLKRGKANNVLMLGSEYLGLGVTRNKYAMYEAGIPYVSESQEHTNIVGEVYKVDKHTLKSLDNLEGHPIWYKRKQVDILFIKDHIANFEDEDINTISAWLYFNEEIPQNASINNTGIFEMPEELYNKYLK